MAKKTESAVSAKQASKQNVVGIAITAETPTYEVANRGEDVSGKLLSFLSENIGQGFTEPMLAEAHGFIRDGKPHQQRVNGPMSKVWKSVQETKKQPAAVPKGHELRLVAVNTGTRMQKAWCIVPLAE